MKFFYCNRDRSKVFSTLFHNRFSEQPGYALKRNLLFLRCTCRSHDLLIQI